MKSYAVTMDERTKTQLHRLLILIGAGAVAGVAYMPFIVDREFLSIELTLRFALQGALIILLVFGFEIFVAEGPASEPLRRSPFAVAFLAKTLITTVLILAAYVIGGLILFPGRLTEDTVIRDLARDTGYALAVSFALQFILMVRNVVGGRVLTNIILGRYHRPLNEERIFLFLDVCGSTALAERVGGVGAYTMISRLFFDVAQETVRFGGETHAYIGDGVVVTWRLGSSLENTRCLRCYFAIRDRIATKAPQYERDFGLVPEFRVGLHGGPVVAGECGDDRHEIVYFGDTINTAARIEQACRDLQRSLLVSGELLRRIDLPPEYDVVNLGDAPLRGRERNIELFTVERR